MPATPATKPNSTHASSSQKPDLDSGHSSLTDNRKLTTENPGRCTHLRADNKRCADAVYPGHTTLCHYHLSQQMRGITDGNSIAADLLSSVGNFQSASAINVVLGKLIIHQLTGRIARREAVALAYTCQLILQTLPLVKQELEETGFSSYWCDETKRILGESSDLDQITLPSLLPEAHTQLHPKDYVDPASATSADSISPSASSVPACAPAPSSPSAPAHSAIETLLGNPTSAANPPSSCRAGRPRGLCGSSVRSTEESPASSSTAAPAANTGVPAAPKGGGR